MIPELLNKYFLTLVWCTNVAFTYMRKEYAQELAKVEAHSPILNIRSRRMKTTLPCVASWYNLRSLLYYSPYGKTKAEMFTGKLSACMVGEMLFSSTDFTCLQYPQLYIFQVVLRKRNFSLCGYYSLKKKENKGNKERKTRN